MLVLRLCARACPEREGFVRCLEVEVEGVGGVGTGTAWAAERVGVTGMAT